MDEKKETQGGLVVNASELRESDLIFWAQQTNPDLQERTSAFYLSPPSSDTETKQEEKSRDAGYSGCLAMLAIIVALIGSLWILVPLLDWLNISFMEGGSHSIIHGIVTIVLMIAVSVYVCLFWKRSAIIRRTVVAILYLGAFVLGWTVLASAMQDNGAACLLLFFVGILLANGALPCSNATVKQCISMLLRTLGAYVPLILSFCLMLALIPFTRLSEYEVVVLSPPLLFFVGLCLTLYLLCRVAVKLSRFFSSTEGKSEALLLFSVGSILSLCVLFFILFLISWGFAVGLNYERKMNFRDDYELQDRLFSSPALESEVPIVDVPEPLESETLDSEPQPDIPTPLLTSDSFLLTPFIPHFATVYNCIKHRYNYSDARNKTTNHLARSTHSKTRRRMAQ